MVRHVAETREPKKDVMKKSVRFILEAIHRRTKLSGTTPDRWFSRMGHYTSRLVSRNAYMVGAGGVTIKKTT
ncbi:hypothetical protein IGI04_023724 [Brassica rapa subsp. trilocularis]|uniref:Uncharacterized protein n=1 Tax=Brassica rapa subsp. trilocularis TaxID=1813537 RepID=A0ABQ7M756_BRACM|nr:hypothetical protein IGI04_023724 [Brassica rapa subsp. trilocularis]